MLLNACAKFLLSIACYISACSREGDLEVEVQNGKIIGHILKSANGNDYRAFHQIPYADAPVGVKRFQPPQEPQNWTDVLDATKNTRVCLQNIVKMGWLSKLLDSLPSLSENCLHLNVYTPVISEYENLKPVMLWIHGGAFQTDDLITYGPKYFMDYDVVVVTINYRLGAFGFLTTEDEIIPGNIGLKDQHMAIKWVANNIEAFGGDPSKIVIAGESAGAASVSYQLLSKKNKGLFRGAILQSGSALAAHEFQPSARPYAFQLGRILNKNSDVDNSTQLLNILQAASISDIVKATAEVDKTLEDTPITLLTSAWVPVIENSTQDALITSPMHSAFMSGLFNALPILIGFNSEEALTFIGSASNAKQKAKRADSNISSIIDKRLHVLEKDKPVVGDNLRKAYTSSSFASDVGSFVKYLSDNSYITPTIRQAELTASITEVYLYQFSHKGLIGFSDVIRIDGVEDGVGHGEELPFLWDIPVVSAAKKIKDEDRTTRERLLKMWTNFVKYLNPTPEEEDILQNIEWPKLSTELNATPYLNINTSMGIDKYPRHYSVVNDILKDHIQPPLNVY